MKTGDNIRLMTHMVAGYPDGDSDIEVARGLIDGGSSYLEIQFPFSDPSADGVPIQEACGKALENGFKVDDGFALVSRVRDLSKVPVFIMSYGSVVFARGVERFVDEAVRSGAAGLIIPDLMPGYDEHLFEVGNAAGIAVVPVIPPGLDTSRLTEILAHNPPYLYASLRVGITGVRTRLDGDVYAFLEQLRGTGLTVFAGFGIQTHEQVLQLKDHAHALIVGSSIVRAVGRAVNDGVSVYSAVKHKVTGLLAGEDGIEKEEAERR